MRGAKAVRLGDAPAQCVVLVAEDLALRLAVFACAQHHRLLGQPVLVVVAVVLLRVAAYELCDQATKPIVVVTLVLQHIHSVVLPPLGALRLLSSSALMRLPTSVVEALRCARAGWLTD